MKVKYLIIFLVIGLFFISGLTGCPNQGANQGTGTGAFVGGTDGLNFAFVENAPPETVLDNNQDPFFISLSLANKGEYAVPSNKIIATLSGINAEAFGMKSLNTVLSYDLEGKSKTETGVLEGLTEELSFEQSKYKYDLDVDFTTSLFVDLCYQYQTKGFSRLCLKQKTAERGTEENCDINNAALSIDNSGAPMQVKDLKQISSGVNQIKVTFGVENVGNGEVYPPDAFTSTCKKDLNNIGKLKVEVSTESGTPIKCGRLDNKDRGVVKLSGKETTIVCEIDTSKLQNIAFEEPFNIKLLYFYKEGIGKQITVEA